MNQGDTFSVDDQQYTVSAVSAEVEGGGGGGHGGGGGEELVRSGTLEYTNESALYTVEWANGSSVTYEDQAGPSGPTTPPARSRSSRRSTGRAS
ncbi:hypothetical protein ACFQRB_02860 [Halobaculum litoreum]|uniref:Uncharacterized protein n=1 Tax=Halobaculum litoreum TaxID=3031998 RepID=A0ABD5XL13_9EURY